MVEITGYTVIVSAKASKMLVEHTAFLARVSINASNKLIADFKAAAQTLTDMPHRCAWLSGDYIPHNKYRFLVFADRYMLIFQVKDNDVFVDYVLDCRQDYAWLIK